MTVMAPLTRGEQLLPGYRVDDHLARGEALDVYSAWSGERECLCVIKTLRPDRTNHAAARQRLIAEGQLLCRLSHPHLVRGYELWRQPTTAVVLETLTGQTLGHLIAARYRGLPAADLAELGAQLCSVLGYLHRHGTLHLDLKPANIVATGGHACLLDLSHARPPGDCPAGFGTREYMPPEQLTGGQVSEASDIYGLGGVLYRAATRQRPFDASADRAHHPNRRPRLARLRRRALPRPLIELIAGCLETRSTARPQLAEAAAVLTDLARRPQECADGAPVPRPTPTINHWEESA